MKVSPKIHAELVIGDDGIIIAGNKIAEEFTGYTCSQLLGKPISELLVSDEFDLARPPSGWLDEISFGAYLHCADEHKIAVRVTAVTALKKGAYKNVRNLSFVTDEILSRSTLIRSLPVGDIIEDLPCVFYVIDENYHLVLWNRQLEEALEMTFDEMRNVSVITFFDTKERAAIAQKIAAAFTNGQSSIEAEVIGKYGKRTAFSFHSAVMHLAGQRSIFGTGLDVTARRKIEHGLQVRERALHSSLNAIVITNYNDGINIIEYVNPAFEHLTGYTFEEVKGRNPRFMRIEECDIDEHKRLHDAIQSKTSVRSVLRNQKKTGEVFWNELRIDPVTNGNGDVTHFVAVLNDVTETKHYERRLHHLAHHDPLTGLANRTLLLEQLRLAIDDAIRGGYSGALAFLDLDNFKHINDTFGHAAGDLILCQVARRLRTNLRDEDTVARFGGDEFVVLLREQSSLEHTADLIGRIRCSISSAVQIHGGEMFPCASIGVSMFPHNGDNIDQVLRAADAAMYHAKSLGKNNVQYYSAELGGTMQRQLLLQAGLARAIDNKELLLEYQPRVNLRTGKMVGAEALVRWQQPGLAKISPDEFIPTAEETGLIVPLGDWVLNEACKTLSSLIDAGMTDFVISVNLSARQLRQREFASHLESILLRHHVPAQNLELEVTESQLMDRPDEAKSVLNELKTLGVMLSIDDFGTGYSSLSHLRSFPVDYVKIDRSFLADLCQGEHTVIPRAIIDLGHNLKLEVIAEGVESYEQMAFLRKHGCDQMQGFYFSPSVPYLQLHDMLVNDIRLNA